MMYDTDDNAHSDDSQTNYSDEEESSDLTPLIQSAIDEVFEDAKSSDSIRELMTAVIEKLVYYFNIKTDLDNSTNFVENVTSKIESLRETLGGDTESLLQQILGKYSTFIMAEIRRKRDNSDDETDSKEGDGETEGEEEDEEGDNDDADETDETGWDSQ